MEPLVSIGMPIFNCEKTLKLAVRSLLNQTYSHWELLLIDDGSEDQTLKIAMSFKDPRIRIIADGLNQKLQRRLNQAIALSQGKYFARMDGDDIAYPERLKSQVEYLEAHPEIDLLGTKYLVFDGEGKPMGITQGNLEHNEICHRPRAGFNILHPTWMGKIEWFRTYQYQTWATRIEDYEILLRSYPTSHFACIPNILLAYRVADLSLKKILLSRYNLSKILLGKAWQEKNYGWTWGVVEQLAKGSVDVVAMSTGLNLKILRHRAGNHPVSSKELRQWKEIWEQCNRETEDI
ncbi:glycosyltransferase family 2 protein [Microcoleus sp. AR_TQ3_B6]|uniref:glycosyltransferase family 2 protein n=1 Tax=Microcoleus sp. AR_TQ3_B6 TaxID=3055284 RepID=UPI002FCEE058